MNKQAKRVARFSETPWLIHRTGSHLGIKDAKGKFVIRKTVNMLSVEQYNQLSTDLEHIVSCVNLGAIGAPMETQNTVTLNNESVIQPLRESFYHAECLRGHVWDDSNDLDDEAFSHHSCPFGGGLFSRCGATLTIEYIRLKVIRPKPNLQLEDSNEQPRNEWMKGKRSEADAT